MVYSGNPQNSEWFRDRTPVFTVSNGFIPNHNQIRSDTGSRTDLVITNVSLEDDNIVYSCNSEDGSINSSVVLNVSGSLYVHINDYVFVVF